MGILDPKTRILDVALTPNGRAALARGGLNVAYASFTDGQTFYDPASITGSYDTATDRIFLEVPSSLPQDTLALVTDDSGDLIPASAFGTDIDARGTLYVSSISGKNPVTGYSTGNGFSSAVDNIVNMFQTSFEYNSIIGTRPPLDSDTSFEIVPISGTFSMDGVAGDLPISEIDTADSLFFDKRFANLPQFKFLPPTVSSGGTSRLLGKYRNIKRFNQYTYEDLKRDVFGTDRNPIKERRDFDIERSSLSNDIVMQMYEITNDGVAKLDAVDYGEVIDYSDKEHQQKRILFFGKVFVDNSETATFINLFTVVID
jgi:hypothetical protein